MPRRSVRCWTMVIDGMPVRVRGDRPPTEADVNAMREVVAALRNQVSRKAGLDISALDSPDSAHTDQRGDTST